MSISMEEMDAYVAKAKELQRILRETPEIIEYMELSQKKPTVVVPPLQNVLVQIGDVTRMLKISNSYVYRLINSGMLTPYYTPGSKCMKFWLKDVMKVASRERRGLPEVPVGKEVEAS